MRSELAKGTVPLHRDISGDGGYPVILLHGLFGSTSNLMGIARALSPFYQVLRLDLRNHGKSAHSEVMTIAAMARDVVAFMDELGIARAHVLGHSLGGKVAMQVAVTCPERVNRLVVADIAPVVYGRGHDDILAALNGLDLRSLENRQQADTAMLKSVPEPAVRQFLLKNLVRDEDQWAWRMNLKTITEAYDEFRDAPDKAIFSGPTLFIRGEASDYVRDEYRVGMQKQFPNMALCTIAGAGHWLHAEKPQEFNDAVMTFLAGRDDS